MAHKTRLPIEQGADFIKEWLCRDAAGVLVDFTGCSAEGQFRESVDATTALFTVSTANARIVLGGATGLVTMRIAHPDTSAMQFTDAVFDLEVTFPSAQRIRLLEGSVSVSPEVTRP